MELDLIIRTSKNSNKILEHIKKLAKEQGAVVLKDSTDQHIVLCSIKGSSEVVYVILIRLYYISGIEAVTPFKP